MGAWTGRGEDEQLRVDISIRRNAYDEGGDKWKQKGRISEDEVEGS